MKTPRPMRTELIASISAALAVYLSAVGAGIFVEDILDAVPIDKYFELFKPGAGGDGGFIRVAMNYDTQALPGEQGAARSAQAGTRRRCWNLSNRVMYFIEHRRPLYSYEHVLIIITWRRPLKCVFVPQSRARHRTRRCPSNRS